jgi:hypothetical protein
MQPTLALVLPINPSAQMDYAPLFFAMMECMFSMESAQVRNPKILSLYLSSFLQSLPSKLPDLL